ncbi:polysaccharide deacetylase family protein [Paenibacillus sp. D2_2]|uniref:polysaccharide deacetylase family protein n=1 Tax=Paenibacillus sp. D2_2 TaxID=3073092 RepID=UPI0028157C9B|nr:polysaccharide deacetylase family protein [Paenibacillus sp. D2_2]WMT40795.1 polysaccharide deacetylase family protein [Paenibacillus sp. D2_2]
MENPLMIGQVNTKEKVIAFTFDDGPNATYTPQILDIFQQAEAKATFFTIGEQIEQNLDLLREMFRYGHEIGNHTYTHPHLTELDEAGYRYEIGQTEKLITEVTGVKPQVFRPPFFDINPEVYRMISALDYSSIGAVNTASLDWEQPGVQHIIDTTKSTAQPGSILLFHDGYGDRTQTIEAVRKLVKDYTANGYKLVTVSQLLQPNPY